MKNYKNTTGKSFLGELRNSLRKKRRYLTIYQQRKHAKSILYQTQKRGIFRHGWRIALYLPFDGEIQTNELINFLTKQGKKIYLPILWGKSLRFAQNSKQYKANYFHIKEPIGKKNPPLLAKKINIIIMPCVGFDAQGNRLGFGGGFYDQTLAFKSKQHRYEQPKLYGLAHHCQKTQTLISQPWDIKPNMIITNKDYYTGV